MLKIVAFAFRQKAASLAIILLAALSTLAADTSQSSAAASRYTLQERAEKSSLTAQTTPTPGAAEVKPSDWAFQALQSLANRYGCLANSPNILNPGNVAVTRAEFAAALNTCLSRIAQISPEDSALAQRLQAEFAAELAALPVRAETVLESTSDEKQPNQFSNASKPQPPAPPPLPRPAPQLAPPAGNIQMQPAPATTSDGYVTLQSERNQNMPADGEIAPQEFNREGYSPIQENPFQRVRTNPLSTFSIDVDTASYSNLRRFINSGQLPPKDAIRIEELVNYFTYNYPQPKGDRPFSISTEVAKAPWNPRHKLVQIGLQGKKISTENLPPSNLVFLLDVSGSMDEPNKLPLVKASLRLLVNELTAKDSVTIVVYAGAAGLVLPPTPGSEKAQILEAIDRLNAGGSTAGGEGIQLAYKLARENFIQSGNNRVILATDGDFNVGASSDAELVRLIEEKRQLGIFLTVLGFGTGNYQDAKMEQLANKGNGNYAYLDSLLEAKKVLVNEIGATLLTIAKDVKIQVEFNPAKVQAYRLIGYENRLLREQDFNDDTKDAGELGAGHSVTALYEIIPAGVESDVKLPDVDELKYQQTAVDPAAYASDELMQVKLRYKAPDATESELIVQSVTDRDVTVESASENLKFAAAVAGFGMLLRDSDYKGNVNFEEVLSLANQAKGEDKEGYRAEFIRLVENSKLLANSEGRSANEP